MPFQTSYYWGWYFTKMCLNNHLIILLCSLVHCVLYLFVSPVYDDYLAWCLRQFWLDHFWHIDARIRNCKPCNWLPDSAFDVLIWLHRIGLIFVWTDHLLGTFHFFFCVFGFWIDDIICEYWTKQQFFMFTFLQSNIVAFLQSNIVAILQSNIVAIIKKKIVYQEL